MTILIIFSLTIQSMVKVAIVGWYELNKDYIAKALCENRNKPEMKCCGKCYLRKQLKKVDETGNNSQAPAKFSKTELSEFVLPQQLSVAKIQVPAGKQHNAVHQQMFGRDASDKIFHPPAVA